MPAVTFTWSLFSEKTLISSVVFEAIPLLFCLVYVTLFVIEVLAVIFPVGRVPWIVTVAIPLESIVVFVLGITVPFDWYRVTCAFCGTFRTKICWPFNCPFEITLLLSITGLFGLTLNSTLTFSVWPFW